MTAMKRGQKNGFALPTTLIAGTILMIVLAVSLGAVSNVYSAVTRQYYERLARVATESGSEYAVDCILKGSLNYSATLTPSKKCDGSSSSVSSYVVDTSTVRTTFSVTAQNSAANVIQLRIVGRVEVLGQPSSRVIDTFEYERKQLVRFEQNAQYVRASQRFWYFGARAGLDFGATGTNNPTAISAPGSSPGYAGEGSTVVTDDSGNLVFWTNGRTIWNKNGDVASNSTGLYASYSGTQAVASFPLGYDGKRYAVIANTTGDDAAYTGLPQDKRLYLSIYDTTLNSGNGGIAAAAKNIDVAGSYLSGTYSSESLGAMPNYDGSGYWVYTYGTKKVSGVTNIYAFLIGIDGTVREKKTIPFTTQPTYCSNTESNYGTINFSASYDKMVMMVGATGCNSKGLSQVSGTAYVFNTNRVTGDLTESLAWQTRADTTGAISNTGASVANSGYSADFSPDEKLVYVTQLYPGRLTRYNIDSSGGRGAVGTASQTTIGDSIAYDGSVSPWVTPVSDSQGGGQIRRGPNGVMYFANAQNVAAAPDTAPPTAVPQHRSLGCLTNPNYYKYTTIVTSVGFQRRCSTITFPSGNPANSYSWFGLPQMVTRYTPQIVVY